MWKPGDRIVLRGAGRGRVWWALPAIVVQDSADLIAAYWQAGARGKNTWRRPTPRDVLSSEPVALVDRVWVETDVLVLVTPGAAHSVYMMREAGSTALRCWYINLQAPLRRTPIGFDTTDHWLDIVISPDWAEWCWKDEDEFKEAEELGIYSSGEAQAIRMEGERAVRLMLSGQSIIREGWEKWKPPTDWGVPGLPNEWNTHGGYFDG